MIALPALAGLPCSPAAASPAQDFVLYCMGCHGAEAQGVPGRIPPLAHSLGFFMRSEAGRDYILHVPGASNSALSNTQLAAVLNWLLTSYSAAELPAAVRWFTADEVHRARSTPIPGIQARRTAVVHELAADGPAPAEHY